MYLKTFNVALSETDARPQKPIVFYEDDILASAIKFKITNQSRPFNVTSDCKFKICMDTKIPNTADKGKTIIIEQDNQDLVEVLADKVGEVVIKLGEEIMDFVGKDMQMHLEIYNDEGARNTFKCFPITIEKNLH